MKVIFISTKRQQVVISYEDGNLADEEFAKLEKAWRTARESGLSPIYEINIETGKTPVDLSKIIILTIDTMDGAARERRIRIAVFNKETDRMVEDATSPKFAGHFSR
jgi:hypothetical protein